MESLIYFKHLHSNENYACQILLTTLRLKGIIITWIGCTSCDLYVSIRNIYRDTNKEYIREVSFIQRLTFMQYKTYYYVLLQILKLSGSATIYFRNEALRTYILYTVVCEPICYPFTTPFEGSSETYKLVRGSVIIYHRSSFGEESRYPESAMARHCFGSLYFPHHENSNKGPFVMFPRRCLR